MLFRSLIGNARLATQEFKIKLENNEQIQEIIFWEKEQLAEFSELYGLAGIHQNTAKGLKGFAQFYLAYSMKWSSPAGHKTHALS